jgi:NAD(P)-dependent dehydrogenase (short-subunit alcohol dehydrogenase family)
MRGRFENKVAIVTGGANGMGAAIARRFLAEGGRVVTCDLSLETLRSAHPETPNLVTLEQDISVEGAAANLVHAAVGAFGQLDIIVNNAGNSLFTPVEQLSDEEWHFHFDVNLHAAFRLCREAIPELKKSAAGRIINITSIHTIQSRVGQGAYTAAKLGLAGLTKVLAIELGPHGITANCIVPGPILTGIMKKYIAEDQRWERKLTDETALGRVGAPEEIAGPVLFLASEDASFITGVDLIVDGGVLTKI